MPGIPASEVVFFCGIGCQFTVAHKANRFPGGYTPKKAPDGTHSKDGRLSRAPRRVSFWLRANQFGSVPLAGASLSLLGRVARDYDTTRHRLLDWGMALEGRANAGQGANLLPIEAYAKLRLGVFELKAGRSKDRFGLTDTLLSAGSFSVSGNALGIPNVQISIPEFYTLPFFRRWVAVKGTLSHGWLGDLPIANKRVASAISYLHQKSLYGRLGRPGGKVYFYGGVADQVFWGNERQIFESFILTDWQIYQSVAFGRNWAGSKVGNHVGTIDAGFEITLPKVRLFAYRQQIYEVGGLYYLANIADGLTGLSLTNRTQPTNSRFRWKKLLLEFAYTKNQAGKVGGPITPTGAENYYNHYLYAQGYSYLQRGMGSPLMTPAREARTNLSSAPNNYFINNRLWALHGGFAGQFFGWDVEAKATYSRNFGTYQTSGMPYLTAAGAIASPRGEVFTPVGQFSSLVTGTRNGRNNRYWGASLAWDRGNLLHSSVAVLIKAGVWLGREHEE